MKVSDLKTFVYNLVKEYFAGATVVWGGIPTAVKPNLPFVVLQTGDIMRSRDGILIDLVKYTESRMTVDVNLYTKGKKVELIGGAYYENTATMDLNDFINFLLSPYAQDKFRANNVGLDLEGGVRDLSQILDEEYEFRAMQELVLTFIDDSAGYAGISAKNWQQNSSGGGSQALAENLEYNIEQVIFDNENEENEGE